MQPDHFGPKVRPGPAEPFRFWTAIMSVVVFWLVVFAALCVVGVVTDA